MQRDIPPLDQVRETAASRAYRAIRERILRCELEPGALINERALMRDTSFGRTPVREALLRLSTEGLVIFSGQGIHIAPVTFESVSALYTARLHAERLAWQLWLRTVNDERTSRLAAAFYKAEEFEARADEKGLVELDFGFHSQVYEECGNAFLAGHLYNLLGLSFRLWFVTNPNRRNYHLQTALSHEPIIAAVRARDADALDRVVSKHITSAFHAMIERMKGADLAVAERMSVLALT
jgi:DNA-binding GntR family transcriptional regulator